VPVVLDVDILGYLWVWADHIKLMPTKRIVLESHPALELAVELAVELTTGLPVAVVKENKVMRSRRELRREGTRVEA
jgi:hypothetical protein